MDERKAETRYLQRRVADSLRMAAAAAEPCAQLAHLTLARLYGEALDASIARPERQTFHALFSDAITAKPGLPRDEAASFGARPMILQLAERERHLASALLS